MSVAAIVLAAGSSKRMGSCNKLLAAVDGVPMLSRVIDTAVASKATPVLVVTGYEAEAVCRLVVGRPVHPVHNTDHREGMSASIQTGLRSLGCEVGGALICLGDMPWITSAHLDRLIEVFEAGGGRANCVPTFEGQRGHPVLFSAHCFAEILALSGDRGAREILERHAEEVVDVAVDGDGILRDVDEPDGLEPGREG